MKQENININYERLSYSEIGQELRTLYEKALDAGGKAYSPYSNFKVGAAVKLENGKIITGNNQENSAYPSGLCAERVAVFYANSFYPDVPVTDLFIIAINSENDITENPVTPCGSCRQVLRETEVRYRKKINIFLAGKQEIIKFIGVLPLLPLAFDNDSL